MITDEYIAFAIENAKEKANKDRYGQLPTHAMQVEYLFPVEERVAVYEHLKTSVKYCLSSYGGRYVSYNAICERLIKK